MVGPQGAAALAAAAGGRLWRQLWRRPACVCGLLAVLCYVNTLQAGFVYDDTRAIVTNGDVRGTTPLPDLLRHDFWGTPLEHAGSHGSYRPLTVLTFRLNHALAGLRPAAFHATNVALHAGCSALVAETARSLAAGRRAALLAGALFAVHPVHAEAVAGLVGRADLLALLFTLCSLLSYARQARGQPSGQTAEGWGGSERRWLAAALGSAVLAVLCKEQGIAALPLCLLYDVWVHSRASLTALITSRQQDKRLQRLRQSCVLVSLACCALLAARLSLLRGQLPWFSAADNPVASCGSWFSRTLTLLHLPAVSAGLLLLPLQLSYDWSETAVPLITSLADVRNFTSAALYATLAAMFYVACYSSADTSSVSSNNNVNVNHNNNNVKKPSETSSGGSGRAALLFALSFVVIMFLPASNLFFYVGFLVAERALYAPSVGFCLLVGAGLALTESRWRRLGPAVSLLLLTVMATRTVVRNQDWRDDRALYTAGIQHSPAKSLGNLATILASQGRLEEAERAYRAALSVRGNMADVHYNLGNLLYSQGKYRQSAACYQDAVGYRRQFAQAYLNLAHAHLKLGQSMAARQVLLACRDLNGSRMRDPRSHASARVGCLVELGRLYAEEDKDPPLALKQYRLALSLAPSDYNKETIYNLIGEAQYRMANYEEAESWFKKALELQPAMVHAHLFYGKMLAKNKTRVDEAEGWFHRAQTTAPNNYVVYLHYGQFLYETGRLSEAADVYVRGTELAPTEYDLTFNLANVYRELGRYQQAEHFYRRAAHIRPEDVQSHRNLGAILHLTGQLREAESAYLTALHLSPGDHVTEVNLARLYNVMERHDLRPRTGGPERRDLRARAANGT